MSDDEWIERLDDHTVMYRPVGPAELALLAESDFRAWPPRLPHQPIFYPVTNEFYASEIARRWNVPDSGCGFVTRFRVRNGFADRFSVHLVGAGMHREWWIPADLIPELNDNLLGRIEVVEVWGAAHAFMDLVSLGSPTSPPSEEDLSLSTDMDSFRVRLEWESAACAARYATPLECMVFLPGPDGSVTNYLVGVTGPPEDPTGELVAFHRLPAESVQPGQRLTLFARKDEPIATVTILADEDR